MRFRDSILLRLLDPATRDTLFDPGFAEALAHAAYLTDVMPLDPPFSARCDRIEPGLVLSAPARGEAQVVWPNQAAPVTARLELSGLVQTGIVADALWEGSVTATGLAAQARIESIAGAVGRDGRLAVQLRQVGDAQPGPMTLAVAAALLVDDPDDPERDLPVLMARVRRVRAGLQVAESRPTGRGARHDFPVVLVLHEARLDDAIWPGAAPGAAAPQARAARLAAANRWANPLGVIFATSALPG